MGAKQTTIIEQRELKVLARHDTCCTNTELYLLLLYSAVGLHGDAVPVERASDQSGHPDNISVDCGHFSSQYPAACPVTTAGQRRRGGRNNHEALLVHER